MRLSLTYPIIIITSLAAITNVYSPLRDAQVCETKVHNLATDSMDAVGFSLGNHTVCSVDLSVNDVSTSYKLTINGLTSANPSPQFLDELKYAPNVDYKITCTIKDSPSFPVNHGTVSYRKVQVKPFLGGKLSFINGMLAFSFANHPSPDHVIVVSFTVLGIMFPGVIALMDKYRFKLYVTLFYFVGMLLYAAIIKTIKSYDNALKPFKDQGFEFIGPKEHCVFINFRILLNEKDYPHREHKNILRKLQAETKKFSKLDMVPPKEKNLILEVMGEQIKLLKQHNEECPDMHHH